MSWEWLKLGNGSVEICYTVLSFAGFFHNKNIVLEEFIFNTMFLVQHFHLELCLLCIDVGLPCLDVLPALVWRNT